MPGISHIFKVLICVAVFCSTVFEPSALFAQESEKKETVEPVFRVPKIKAEQNTPAASNSAVAGRVDSAEIAPAEAGTFATRDKIQQRQINPSGPVARVADASVAKLKDKITSPLVPKIEVASSENAHPLDRAIEVAKTGLENMQSNIQDYTAVLVKRERVGKQLGEPVYMKIKIRNPRVIENRNVPFSIYMKFMKPRSVVGREVIWVEGQNKNNLIVHDLNPIVKFRNMHLDPSGFMAMKGNRYPIYDAGLENLVIKLIEKAERDKAAGVCEVKYLDGARINKRPCTLIEVVHHKRRAPYEFHIAKVYIDEEYQIPVRFVAYDWPGANGKPQILEEYTYFNVKLNVGLSDNDFNIANASYNFIK